MKNLKPLFLFSSLLLIVGLACSALSGGSAPTQTQAPEQPAATQAPAATQPPAATEAPTDVPATEAPATEAPVASKFFTEEFDQDPGSNWSVDILGPGADANKDSAKATFENGNMRIELPKNDLYYYYTYNGESYDNVRLDLRADNRGVNTNNVSLTCRVGKDGWYEWSVGSGGDWYLYAVTDKYNLLTNGGSNFLKQGKDVNEYTLICKDKKISMFINGKEIKQSPVTDTKYALTSGSVGFNVSSLNVTPVIVDVEWFKVSEP